MGTEVTRSPPRSLIIMSSTQIPAVSAVVLSYVLMITSNALSSNTAIYTKTNADIANSSPNVYLVPDGLTFAVWGIIYLCTTVFVVYQALPSNHNNAALCAIRLHVSAAYLLNAIWLPVFQFKFFFCSQVIICCYLYVLWTIYNTLQPMYLDPTAPLSMKLAVWPAFSTMTAWVTIATLVGFGVTLANNGWAAPPDFGMSLVLIIWGPVLYLAFTRAEWVYSAITMWALWGIARNQSQGSTFNGPLSDAMRVLAWVSVAAIFLATLTGIARQCLLRISASRAGNMPDSLKVALPAAADKV